MRCNYSMFTSIIECYVFMKYKFMDLDSDVDLGYIDGLLNFYQCYLHG